MKKRILSLFTALALCLSLCPTGAAAAEDEPDTGLCDHHPEHIGCGCTAPTGGQPCGHVHTEDCYLTDDAGGEVLDCQHTHDEDCGYVPADPGQPCGFVCRICPIEDLIAALPDEITPDNAKDVRAQLDEILMLFSELTEDEQEQIDLSRCYELQEALDNANAPMLGEAVVGDVTLAGGDIIILSTDGCGEDCSGHKITQSGSQIPSALILVESGTHDVTFSGLNLTGANVGVMPGGTMNLTLESSNTITSSNNTAGIYVPVNATLVITEESKGSLTVSGNGAAGIGGAWSSPTDETGDFNCGTVVINGGTIVAAGEGVSAGIGGGESNSDGGNGGNITINGGTVTATGGSDSSGNYSGAGIGGASGNSSQDNSGCGGTLTINGGHVTLTAGSSKSYGFGKGSGGTPSGPCELMLADKSYLALTDGTALDPKGTYTINGDPTEDMIVAPDLEYTGEVLDTSGIRIDESKTGTAEYFGQTFQVKTSAAGWKMSIVPGEVKEVGNYTVTFTKDGKSIQKTFAVVSCLHRGEIRYEPQQGTETHNVVCVSCNTVLKTEDCTFGSFAYQDETNHKGVCVCGKEKLLPHSWGDNVAEKEYDEAMYTGTWRYFHTCTDCSHREEMGTLVFSYGPPEIPYGQTAGKQLSVTGDLDKLGVTEIYWKDQLNNKTLTEPGKITSVYGLPEELECGRYTYSVYITVAGAEDYAYFSFQVTPLPLTADMVTLSPDSAVYDGTAHMPAVTVTHGDKTLTEGTDYTVGSYANNINAGTAAVTVTGKGNYGGTAEKTFIIQQAAPTITWSTTEQELTYTGQPAAVTAPAVTLVNSETFSGTINYSYTKVGETTSINGLPTDAGTYTVRASTEAAGNYAAADSTNTLTLTIKPAPVTLTFSDQTITYGETAAKAAVNPASAEITYSYTGAATGDGWPVNAGTYTVTAEVKATGNYSAATATAQLVINKAALAVTGATITTRPYQPNYHAAEVSGVTFAGLVNGETLALGTDYKALGNYDTPDAGTDKAILVDVQLTSTAKANNYRLTKDLVNTTGTITRASQTAPSITGLPAGTIIYGDTFTLTAESGVNWSASGAATVDSSGKVTVTGVGKAAITAAKPGTINYEPAEARVTFTAVPRALTVTGLTVTDRAYDGTSTVEITGVALDGILNGDDVSVDTTGLTGTLDGSNVGSYTAVTLPRLTLTGADAGNYTVTEGAVPASVTIEKAPARTPKTGNLAVSNKRARTYIYGLDALCPDLPEGMSLGSSAVTYTLGTVSLGSYYTSGAKIEGQTLTLPIEAVESDSESEIGTITILIHTGNFEDMTATIHVRSVNKIVPTGEPTLSGTTLTYGQALSAITLSGSMQDNGTPVSGTFAWSNPDNRPAVQESYAAAWVFTPDDNGKYAIVTGTAVLTITKATPSLTLTASPAVLPNGGTVTLTLSGLPAGGSATVTCSEPGITVTKGSENIWTAVLPAGGASYTFTAAYAGDENHNSATAECSVSIDKIMPSLKLSPSAEVLRGGGVVTLTLTGLPADGTADVTCSGGIPVTPGEDNTWTATLPNSTAAYAFTATYAGSAACHPASASCTVETTELIILPDPPAGDDGEQFQLVMETGISEVPAGLQGIETLNTPEKLETALKTEISQVSPDIPEANTAVYDVSLLVSRDGGATWEPAKKENFPDRGLTVTLPYPSGTNSSYRFTVVHMFTTSDFGNKPGDTEVFTPDKVKNTAKGLQVVVTGLSPISVGWEPPETPVTPSGPSGSSGSSGSSHVSRGDSYEIAVAPAAHGKVSASASRAESGATITLTVRPDEGYVLDHLTVTDSRSSEIRLTEKDGKFTFTMPARAVTVEAAFVRDDAVPEETDSHPDCPSRAFADLDPDEWYHEAVDFALSRDIMSGTNNGFAPGMPLSRAMLAQLLWNHAGKPSATAAGGFPDVPANEWYTEAVDWAASAGIVSGYSDGRFGPNDNVTREQFAVMLWRSAGSPAGENPLNFSDTEQVSGYALEALRWAADSGIISGKSRNRLDPQGTATRAEAAQMLMNYLRNE